MRVALGVSMAKPLAGSGTLAVSFPHFSRSRSSDRRANSAGAAIRTSAPRVNVTWTIPSSRRYSPVRIDRSDPAARPDVSNRTPAPREARATIRPRAEASGPARRPIRHHPAIAPAAASSTIADAASSTRRRRPIAAHRGRPPLRFRRIPRERPASPSSATSAARPPPIVLWRVAWMPMYRMYRSRDAGDDRRS